MDTLSYRHEDDRAYGVTGMTIGLVIYDGEDMLDGVDLDADTDEMLSLSNQFYFNGNPSLSAKTAWNTILRNFNLMTAMVLSNAMCRAVVQDGHQLTADMRRSLHDVIAGEAADSCSLDTDEMERLFDKNFSYLNRVFNHRGVQSIARDMAAHLKEVRHMSRLDVLEQLKALAML